MTMRIAMLAACAGTLILSAGTIHAEGVLTVQNAGALGTATRAKDAGTSFGQRVTFTATQRKTTPKSGGKQGVVVGDFDGDGLRKPKTGGIKNGSGAARSKSHNYKGTVTLVK